MGSFSERLGLLPKQAIQYRSMSDELKTRLWNLIHKCFLAEGDRGSVICYPPQPQKFVGLIYHLYDSFYKSPTDNLSTTLFVNLLLNIRSAYFETKFSWNNVYDLVEFLIGHTRNGSNMYSKNSVRYFEESCNAILEEEVSAYRVISGKVTEITSQTEIEEIGTVLDHEDPKLTPVQTHIRTALERFSDRENPDYRNSVKESILAVEAMAQQITGDDRATLGKALKKMSILHPALKDGFVKIYGYTNAADGIRHALSDESNVNSEDARYFLVTCSAFVNYMMVKASKA